MTRVNAKDRAENPAKADLRSLIARLARTQNTRLVRQIENAILQRIKRKGAPLVDEDWAHFFYQSKENIDICLVGDWNKWKPGQDKMQRINRHSSLYYFTIQFPIDARLPYRFRINSQEPTLDPLNPNIQVGVFGANTYVRMPGCRAIPYGKPPKKGVPRGKLIELEVKGNEHVASRTVQIYVPHGLPLGGKKRFLYVNDGAEAITVGKFTDILDNLFHNEPNTQRVITVFVPPVARHDEYDMSPSFAKWFATDLTRAVERKLRTRSEAKLRAVQGASLGGLFAMYLGLSHYKKFRNIAAQSPSFWRADHAIIKAVAKERRRDLRIYLQTGTINDAQAESRAMLRVLQEKEYPIVYRETNESHNWANWSARYADIVRWMSAK
jgi:enterochelin esterase-like enzyme